MMQPGALITCLYGGDCDRIARCKLVRLHDNGNIDVYAVWFEDNGFVQGGLCNLLAESEGKTWARGWRAGTGEALRAAWALRTTAP